MPQTSRAQTWLPQQYRNKRELYAVKKRLKKVASNYKLVLLCFSPAIEAYFSSSPEDRIVKLPLEITVNGNYLDIGRFLENWHRLPFYLISEEIELKRVEENGNILGATITASLYTWNE